MDGAPATIENSANDPPSAPAELPPAQPDVNGGSGGVGGGGGGEGEVAEDGGFTEDVDRNSGGNRWPKQETLALIRIRSEMDAAFRDSNLKAPLWDEVSRKLSELGFHRSAKKCREKFENVYKYHRRTKDGRSSKSDKIYRFSDQLQALESNHRGSYPPLAVKPPPGLMRMTNTYSTVPSPYNATGSDQNNASPISVAAPAVSIPLAPALVNHKRSFPFSQPTISGSTNSGSSRDTDEPPRKKRRWEGFFEKLVKELMEKQEQLQVKFLETLDRRERDRVAKEEAWRAQEIAKLDQEHDRLVKERSILAAKDAAIVAFLQNLIGKSLPVIDDGVGGEKITALPQPQTQQTPPAAAQQPSLPPHREVLPSPVAKINPDGVEENAVSPSPSRWPKAEINALITLRSQLDTKYQENVPKGPLWEEISSSMRNLGYNRNPKRCKEKWENINKYYKKIKESNKKRPEDSKTCPYYDQLDALYAAKTTPIIAQPEQQWPPATAMIQQPPPQQQRPPSAAGQEATPPQSSVHMEDQGSEDLDDFDDDHGNHDGDHDHGNHDHDGDGDGDDGDDDDKEDEHGVYEFVASKISSMVTM